MHTIGCPKIFSILFIMMGVVPTILVLEFTLRQIRELTAYYYSQTNWKPQQPWLSKFFSTRACEIFSFFFFLKNYNGTFSNLGEEHFGLQVLTKNVSVRKKATQGSFSREILHPFHPPKTHSPIQIMRMYLLIA